MDFTVIERIACREIISRVKNACQENIFNRTQSRHAEFYNFFLYNWRLRRANISRGIPSFTFFSDEGVQVNRNYAIHVTKTAGIANLRFLRASRGVK